ncbi:hypothetical protein [Nostoc sp. CALU 1950]|uniref:hypothetical protein n=1 Tax=Nostoc sp. CALU 1950 TaxID=3104321 RepID=UPI003EBB25B9
MIKNNQVFNQRSVHGKNHQPESSPLKAARVNQSLGKLCIRLLIDEFLSLVNIQHSPIADNFREAIQQLQKASAVCTPQLKQQQSQNLN